MSSFFSSYYMSSCAPAQVATLTLAIDDISDIDIYSGTSKTDNCKYCNYQVSWSFDGVNWSCFVDKEDAEKSLVNATSDYYVKLKVNGTIGDVTDDGDNVDYTTSIADGISLSSYCGSSTNYNPYSGLSSAIALQQSLSDAVSCMIGIPIYYFKLSPNTGSKDITFKEYALMDVEAVKQIKLIINDGTMPSSKPEFSDFGMEWQTDWETEISKSSFATAFGPTAQPMEGDLVYIPMMKRMWMVNEAYEEKNGSLMWVNTTFKVCLVKYQEKGSVDLGDMQDVVDGFVKNKYENLFSDQEGLDSGTEGTESPNYAASNLYPVFESDATRKYVTTQGTDLIKTPLYYRGTQISDLCYKFEPALLETMKQRVIYQRQYCGDEGCFSIIIGTKKGDVFDKDILQVNNIMLHVKQGQRNIVVSVPNCELSLTLLLPSSNVDLEHWFIWCRWSKSLNTCDIGAARYVYNEKIPLWKLQPAHYWFDTENPYHKAGTWNIEMASGEKGDIVLHGFPGTATNIKVLDKYNDNLSELLQQYPNNQHLLVNDTARRLVDLQGSSLG